MASTFNTSSRMLRPRPLLASSLSTVQFFLRPPRQSYQVRNKTIKHLYKGGLPKNPKPTKRPAQIAQAPEVKSIPPKKTKDPLQGMREAAERQADREKAMRAALAKRANESVVRPNPDDGIKSTTAESEKSTTQGADVASGSEPYGGRPIPPAFSTTPDGDGPKKFWTYPRIIIAVALVINGYFLLRKFVFAKKQDNVEATDKNARTPSPENVIRAIKRLQDIFGDRCSTLEEDLDELGGEGIMNIGHGKKPRAAVWPEKTEEVEVILKIAEDYGVPVIPHSGGTSLEGQCVPVTDAIAISLSRMNKIIAFRPHDMDITLQPGISWNELNEFLEPYKLFFPVDPGPNAHIGGMIATSASGTNAVRYGTMKDWVLNLTVVLPGGHVMKTRSRARKSSTGYDLTKLFIGSEGTLGVITEVTLKLANLPEKEVVGTISFETNTAAASAVSKLLASGIEPRCVELLDASCIAAVNNSLNKNIAPFPPKPHLFFKLAGRANIIPQELKSLTLALQNAGGTHLRIAQNEKEGEELWAIRKSLAYSLLMLFPGSGLINTDVCVPRSQLPGLIEQYKLDLEKINQEIEAEAQGGEVKKLSGLILGHVGDGNFHSLIVYEKGNEELKKKAENLENMLVMNALALDGTASGEHGRFMNVEYDSAALTLMRAIKQGIDPLGIMNPGTLLPPKDQEAQPRTSTIDREKTATWVVKPHSLRDSVEIDPQLQAIVEENGTNTNSWANWIWHGVQKLGGALVLSGKDTTITEPTKKTANE